MRTFLIGLLPALVLSGCGRTNQILSLDGSAAAGETVFVANCSGCHGIDGLGGEDKVGANLTEKTYAPELIIDTVLDGAGTTMPSFANRLENQEIADVAAYIPTLAESDPAAR